ncbi:MAG: V-type ATP synthase subunit F [Methanosarcinales archaeon]|uniref:A-type ATP synthase subunit F n=3 Tax=GOM Arc I cluster TaxID=1978122 RepID=A0A811TF73_9EURY|nr:V-type ATP synthase subunit F [Candidatus Ethanoperedens thermophilum]RZB31049.1 MAG: V/A-type H+/Na+-transporting ATPase subunit F [Candidatus Argoarchaeum ethanivorans]CAD6494099.1 MAG: V-type ATP synthase subunit F [Candidatus Argoarchaeum ethanivorans]
MELAVVGQSEFTLGFRLAGVKKVYDITDDNLIEIVQNTMHNPEVGIIVMHNDDLLRLPAQLMAELNESVEPTVVAIGGKGESNLREKIKQSVGVDLWK